MACKVVRFEVCAARNVTQNRRRYHGDFPKSLICENQSQSDLKTHWVFSLAPCDSVAQAAAAASLQAVPAGAAATVCSFKL